jgi:hypothetical protein
MTLHPTKNLDGIENAKRLQEEGRPKEGEDGRRKKKEEEGGRWGEGGRRKEEVVIYSLQVYTTPTPNSLCLVEA